MSPNMLVASTTSNRAGSRHEQGGGGHRPEPSSTRDIGEPLGHLAHHAQEQAVRHPHQRWPCGSPRHGCAPAARSSWNAVSAIARDPPSVILRMDSATPGTGQKLAAALGHVAIGVETLEVLAQRSPCRPPPPWASAPRGDCARALCLACSRQRPPEHARGVQTRPRPRRIGVVRHRPEDSRHRLPRRRRSTPSGDWSCLSALKRGEAPIARSSRSIFTATPCAAAGRLQHLRAPPRPTISGGLSPSPGSTAAAGSRSGARADQRNSFNSPGREIRPSFRAARQISAEMRRELRHVGIYYRAPANTSLSGPTAGRREGARVRIRSKAIQKRVYLPTAPAAPRTTARMLPPSRYSLMIRATAALSLCAVGRWRGPQAR